MTIGQVVAKSADWLRSKGVEDSPRLDAELLLARILNCDRLRLYMDWQKPLTELELSAYREYIRRRGQDREPVCHILGERHFYGRVYEVTAETLSPRPETEGLIERALNLLEIDPLLSNERHGIFEVGTGTGIIIITLAAESDGHHYMASDIVPGALAVAKRNAHKHKMDGRIEFRLGSLFAEYEGSLGMVVSNPPYIAEEKLDELPPEVKNFDPVEALSGGPGGFEIIRPIMEGASTRLVHGGWLLLEIGEDQGKGCRDFLKKMDCWTDVRVEKDLAGHDRYVLARRS
ncbi:MAG: peptide chain release factor N(5)-glutamine methyltransferase [Candidatus Sumerlaeia bacterium]|nr:peptide chain release factor N(5)-glutamine methyltransferase [Candidatus Sumerlaeia bacterium]